MKVLVATGLRQGDRDNDFHWCVEGELVWIELVCASGRRNPDGGCGCGRGFGGLTSYRATTTARVAEVDMDRDEYAQRIGYSLLDQNYGPYLGEDEADRLTALAAQWPVGMIVERRLDTIRARGMAPFLDAYD